VYYKPWGEQSPLKTTHTMIKYSNKYKAPRMIESKFNCTCAETGRAIKKGDRCLYFPADKKVYHPDSKTAYQWRMDMADERMMNPNG